MKHEAVGTQGRLDLNLDASFRRVGLILPIFVGIYGGLISTDIIQGSTNFSIGAFTIILGVMVVLGLMMRYVPDDSLRMSIFYIAAYHVVLGAEILFIFGVPSAITMTWVLLIFAVVALFGYRWGALSFLGLVVLMVIDGVINTISSDEMIDYLLIGVIVLMLATVFAALNRMQLKNQDRIIRSREHGLQQRDALITTINATPQAIFTANARGKIKIFNSAFMNLIDSNESPRDKAVDVILPLHDLNKRHVSIE